eukprot:gene18339-23422_t
MQLIDSVGQRTNILFTGVKANESVPAKTFKFDIPKGADVIQDDPIAQPLAARLRSTNLDEYVGQEHLLARGKPLREALEQGALHSMIFWGPPGVGKTTLARLLAKVSDAHFETVSAVLAGVKEIRQAVEVAKQQAGQYGRRTILFVDEVHRFNKS